MAEQYKIQALGSDIYTKDGSHYHFLKKGVEITITKLIPCYDRLLAEGRITLKKVEEPKIEKSKKYRSIDDE